MGMADIRDLSPGPQPQSLPEVSVVSEALGGRGGASATGVQSRFFTEPRLVLLASATAVTYAIGLAWGLLMHKGYVVSRGKCIDFTSFWVSGSFAVSSDPTRMYDASAWPAAWKSLTGLTGGCFLFQNHLFGFGYPPTLFFFTYPLGLMPYSIAFPAWIASTLILYVTTVYLIIPRPVAVIAALTPYTSVVYNVLIGQSGFLTAGLVGLSLVSIERRPWLSGIFLGLLAFKPQLGILFPIALLASRNWRALVSATAVSLLLAVGAAIAFGHQGWPLFIHSLVGQHSSMGEEPRTLVSLLGFLLTIGVDPRISWVAHLAVAVVIAAAVCVVWARPLPYALKAAVLCIGSVMVTPYVHTYDLCILSVAVAFLVGDGLAHGFLRGERGVMLICWFGLLLLVPPVPQLIVCFLLLALVARRIVICSSGDRGVGPSSHSADLSREKLVAGSSGGVPAADLMAAPEPTRR
jgi:arabinofuranan 3-O-arabinosyltransferase